MAKKFLGFTPEQLGKIDPSLQGKQSDEQSKIIASNPALAARVGRMTTLAQKRIQMASGGIVRRGYAPGGVSTGQANLNQAQQELADAQAALQEAMAASQANPEDEGLATAVTNAQTRVNAAQAKVNSATSGMEATDVPSATEVRSDIINDPTGSVTTADVKTTTDTQKDAGTIAEGTGQVTQPSTADTKTVDKVETVGTPETLQTKTYEPLEVTAGVEQIMDHLEKVTGKVGKEALVEAQTMSPEDLAQLGLTAAQIKKAQTVQNAPTRVLEQGELISGSTVDMDRAKKETSFEAATGEPTTNATVQGQLGQLMEDFEGTNPPAWAAGALRKAAAMMAARGLSASSMAGQAAVQAAMESAMPIAQADAATFARFEQQNLSNRQQASMFAAEQRAKFLGMEFTQEFQARVANAAKISDIANMNFTAEQQIALENARLAQSVDLANLQAANAKILADAAALTQLDLTNLSNQQQAQVQNAKTFLQMDLTNLGYEQQDKIFKNQQIVNAMLSDQAATNAAMQFNASSENQTQQFMANLKAQIDTFNAEQYNSNAQFNAGQINAMSQFNVGLEAQRLQFNAANALVIAQANAQWAQAYTLADNAAINAANRDAAMASNNLTLTAYNNILQTERDTISYAFKAAENGSNRDLQLLIAQMQQDVDYENAQAKIDAARGQGWGSFWGNMAPKIFDAIGNVTGWWG